MTRDEARSLRRGDRVLCLPSHKDCEDYKRDLLRYGGEMRVVLPMTTAIEAGKPDNEYRIAVMAINPSTKWTPDIHNTGFAAGGMRQRRGNRYGELCTGQAWSVEITQVAEVIRRVSE